MKHKTLIASSFLVATLMLGTIHPARAAGRIDLPALRTYVEIKDVQLSPDGKRIAYVVNRQNFAAKRYDNTLETVEIATRKIAVLAGPYDSLSSVHWSPDGARLAFLTSAGAGENQHTQIFFVSASGGRPYQFTHAPRGIARFAWRPDGGAIAFDMADVAPNEHDIQAGRDAFEVGDQDYLSTARPTPSHLWLATLKGGPLRRLTSGTWSLPKDELIFPQPEVAPMPYYDWSPDGRSIVVARQENAFKGDAVGTVTEVLDVRTGALRKLTSHKRLEAGGMYSPDGTHIAYIYARDDNPVGEVEVMIAPATGGDGVDATHDLDVDALGARWIGNHRLLVLAFQGVHPRLCLATLKGVVVRLNTGEVDPVPFELDTNARAQIAFAGSEPQRPTEVYYMASPVSAPVRLTNYNAALAARTQSRVEGISWQGPDGSTESGVLYYPPDFTPAKKYPLVLQIHGGPVEASIASWRDTDWPGLPQYIASHGYLVFSPNYRGSDGQGNAYQIAIFNDAGDGPGKDVMAGVEAVKKLGLVDENRMAVSGWSYGGFMTEWLIGHYDVWKAAVAGAAPSDAFVDYSTSNYNVLGGLYFGGSPWDSPALMQAYRDQSPLTYADRVKAPTLLLSDLGDAQVPAIHSFEFYHALRERHVPVSFVVYPVAGHWPDDPVRSEDIYRRWVAWLDRYLK